MFSTPSQRNNPSPFPTTAHHPSQQQRRLAPPSRAPNRLARVLRRLWLLRPLIAVLRPIHAEPHVPPRASQQRLRVPAAPARRVARGAGAGRDDPAGGDADAARIRRVHLGQRLDLGRERAAMFGQDDFDINSIPPIDIGIPKYTENLAITPHGAAPGLVEFGHDFVHALDARCSFPDDDGGAHGQASSGSTR